MKTLGKGLFGRLLSYSAFGLAFWLLFQGISRPNAPLGVLGGVMVLGAMALMVASRRGEPISLGDRSPDKEEYSPRDQID